MMRQQIKLAAVLAVVVLSLTGFSKSSHGHGHSGSSHSSGGGCSSSRSSNGYHSSTSDNDDDDYDGSGSGSGSSSGYSTPTADPTTDSTPSAGSAPTARVVTCAQPAAGSRKAVTSSRVELTPTSYGTSKVDITVTFFDSAGNLLDTAHKKVELDATDGLDPKTFTVPMASPAKVDEVYRCDATAVLAH
ncbi:hypothetical protein OG599_13950 [Streptomyces sp. NBC_01335]|uniref:hypothetical protein n=1 Tax=Streptomyces sp. NBC_01335 TaxID=2903828 RepID=UPI002E1089FD|nr:hypothetical protein OG599_13950 [Streptomyces sp. NBC_01335]